MLNGGNTLRIVTPEGVMFRFALAGPTARFLACTIDAACVMGVSGAISTFLNRSGLVHADPAKAIFTILYVVISVGYGMYFEWYWRGQTIGKKMLGLRVMDAEALHLQPYQVVLRNLMRCVDTLPLFYLVGGVAAALTRRSQRLGDFVAHTVVVKTPRFAQPDLDRIGRAKFNSLLDHPALCARLRQKTPPEAIALAADALLRREQFTPEARVETFAELATYFHSLVSIPVEITEQITPEQLVRNIFEVLFVRAQS
jgi:uncharacterized RDD family membrane protein YckC